MTENDGKKDISWFTQDRSPSREGLKINEVWMWDTDLGRWVVAVLKPNVEPNAGGSPSPVEDGLEEAKTGI